MFASKDIRYDEFGHKRPVLPSSSQSIPDSLIDLNSGKAVIEKVRSNNKLSK